MLLIKNQDRHQHQFQDQPLAVGAKNRVMEHNEEMVHGRLKIDGQRPVRQKTLEWRRLFEYDRSRTSQVEEAEVPFECVGDLRNKEFRKATS